MAKILIPVYVSHRNYVFIQETMAAEGIPTESRAVNWLLTDYQAMVDHRIAALQRVIRDQQATIDKLTADTKETQPEPQ